VVALTAGSAVALWQRTTSFGWFAYAPLSPDDEIQIPRFVTNQELASWTVAACGLVLLAGCIGYVLGARNAGPIPDQRSDDRPHRPAE
jgi:hypothetical protein